MFVLECQTVLKALLCAEYSRPLRWVRLYSTFVMDMSTVVLIVFLCMSTVVLTFFLAMSTVVLTDFFSMSTVVLTGFIIHEYSCTHRIRG